MPSGIFTANTTLKINGSATTELTTSSATEEAIYTVTTNCVAYINAISCNTLGGASNFSILLRKSGGSTSYTIVSASTSTTTNVLTVPLILGSGDSIRVAKGSSPTNMKIAVFGVEFINSP